MPLGEKDEDWADEDRYAAADGDEDLALLSEMLGPRSGAYTNEDLLNDSDDDDDLKQDPVSQMDIKVSFFLSLARILAPSMLT